MLATLVTVVVSTITTPCLGLVSHGLYSLTPAPYLHKQVQYSTVQYSLTPWVNYFFFLGWGAEKMRNYW